jgi:hypothetical protein
MMSQKQTPKSCSCQNCKRGKCTNSGKAEMKRDERAFRHNQKIALNKSNGDYSAAPVGGYYD